MIVKNAIEWNAKRGSDVDAKMMNDANVKMTNGGATMSAEGYGNRDGVLLENRSR